MRPTEQGCLPPLFRSAALFTCVLAVTSVSLLKGVNFAPLYGLIIVGAGWFAGAGVAVLASVMAAAFYLGAQLAVNLRPWQDSLLPEMIGFGLALAAGLGAATLRARLLLLRRQRDLLAHSKHLLDVANEAARLVQLGILPDQLPTDGRVELAVHYEAAEELSGDFYDVQLVGNSLSLCIADVSGKGPAAALITTLLRGILEAQGGLAPAPLLTELNRRIMRYLPESMFITCFYARLELSTRGLTYASAGHDPVLVKRSSSGAVEQLFCTGLPLGVAPETCFAQRTLILDQDDVLVAYTDGIVNLALPSGNRLGDEPLISLLRRRVRHTNCLSLLAEMLRLRSRGHQDDDIVLLVLRCVA